MSASNPIYSDPSKFYLNSSHFSPFNSWKEDPSRGYFKDSGLPKFVIDMTNGDSYLNEPLHITSGKCLSIALMSIPFHLLLAPMNIAKIVSRMNNQPDERVEHSIARIVLTPFTILGMFFASLYGVVNPRDGRKLYATLERFHYHQSVIAECFQPSSEHHERNKIINPPKFDLKTGSYAY